MKWKKKLREIEKKAKGKARKPMSRGNGFRRKTASFVPRSRDIHDDLEPDNGDMSATRGDTSPDPAETPETRRARFRIVDTSGDPET